jgi:hypothetical protein
MAGFGGAACAKETFTTTIDGLSKATIDDSSLVVEVPDRGTGGASWCRLTRTFTDFTVKKTLVGPRLTMFMAVPGAYAAAMNVTIDSGVIPDVIGLENDTWISAAAQPLLEGKQLIHFSQKADQADASRAVVFEFEFNGLLFEDESSGDSKKAQHFTTLSRGVSLRTADLAPAQFSPGKGHLAVSIDIETNRNYNLVVHRAPPSNLGLAGVILAFVGTLLSVLVVAMNTVEGRQDPSQGLVLRNEDESVSIVPKPQVIQTELERQNDDKRHI